MRRSAQWLGPSNVGKRLGCARQLLGQLRRLGLVFRISTDNDDGHRKAQNAQDSHVLKQA